LRILITNDDGVAAPGLECLRRIAEAVGDEVWLCAPETDQSGLAHSLTLNDPLRVRALGERRFAVRGTPTDCVIMAVRQLMPEPPDLVLSGVNGGQNVSDDVTYSGTVAGAIEGTLLGIPSIALSQAFDWNRTADVPFETAEAHGPGLVRSLVEAGIKPGTFVNVNFPDCSPEEVRGIEVTQQGGRSHGLHIDARIDARQRPYYWLTYGRAALEPVPGTDMHALAARRISVTPLRIDLTSTEDLVRLAGAVGR